MMHSVARERPSRNDGHSESLLFFSVLLEVFEVFRLRLHKGQNAATASAPPTLPPHPPYFIPQFPPLPPTNAAAVPPGSFAPIIGTMNVSSSVDGVGYDRRMLLSKRYFSGPVPAVGKAEDIQYELQESETVQIPTPAPLVGTLPLTLLNPALWKPYQLTELNTYEKRRTLLSHYWIGP